jgi:hypothetical protein
MDVNNKENQKIDYYEVMNSDKRAFNYWTVVDGAKASKIENKKGLYLKCQCVCGNIDDVKIKDLIRGSSISCGCIKK